MIAIDSSVLIDLIGGDARATAAEACLRQALTQGPVVVCDVVVSEVVSGLGYGAELLDTLEEAGIVFLPPKPAPLCAPVKCSAATNNAELPKASVASARAPCLIF